MSSQTITTRFEHAKISHFCKIFYQPLYMISTNLIQNIYKNTNNDKYDAKFVDDKFEFYPDTDINLELTNSDNIGSENNSIDSINLNFILDRYNTNLKFKYNGVDFTIKTDDIIKKYPVPVSHAECTISSTYEITCNASDLSLFNDFVENKPCYGLEQEYIFMDSLTNTIYGSTINDNTIHYCSSSIHHAKLRPIVENHYIKCLQMGINISGFNSEVTQSQWEFQIGPTIGIDASDDLTMARFVLERLCESDNLYINYHSKPIKDYNGSGCHHNFSTIHTNKYTKSTFESAYSEIFNNFSNNHKITLKYYGVDNELRLTGINETSNRNKTYIYQNTN